MDAGLVGGVAREPEPLALDDPGRGRDHGRVEMQPRARLELSVRLRVTEPRRSSRGEATHERVISPAFLQ